MTREDDAFLKRLLATFGIEAEEHLKAMSQLLFALEKSAPTESTTATVEALFREAHSLKGAARSVDLIEIEGICRALESIFSKLKKNEIAPSPPFFDILFLALDQLTLYLATDADKRSNWDPIQLIEQIDALGQSAEVRAQTAPPPTHMAAPPTLDSEPNATRTPSPEIAAAPEPMTQAPVTQAPVTQAPVTQAKATPAVPEAPSPILAPTVDQHTSDTVRISTAKLGVLLTQVEELLTFKFNAGHLVGELHGLRSRVSSWKRSQDKTIRDHRTARRSAGRSSALSAVSPETDDADTGFAKSLIDQLSHLGHDTEMERRALSGMLDNLLNDMKQALMLPVSTLFEWVPKLVRDLARDGGKDIELQVSRGSIEIDRRILEQLKTPLIHLIRNAVDHGIETPAERLKHNKSAQGRIAIDVVPLDGNKIELRISDDGAGPNLEKVKAHAIKMGVLTAESLTNINDDEAMTLMFESGLSTSSILTDVSGRGLGLAIVREKIEKIGGNITVERATPAGICFRLILPTTLANFHGILVAIGEHRFVLPSLNVECVTRIALSAVKTIESRDTIELNGQIVSLVRLGDVLQLSRDETMPTPSSVLQIAVLTSAGKRVAFSVDAILGDQEVLVRGLGPQLLRVRNITGATVLGAGQVVPILNPSDLLKSALKVVPVQARHAAPTAARRQSILVVEDSITSRALIKNILESAGYQVTGAVDGVDAITTLRTGQFDLVVSDVEMPRMDGFMLTGQIRADKRFSELPVILVTALDSREHKERGIEVGANAYLVKSSFEQRNLLDAVKRLI